jgi:uncharacterized RDD family membrane protein YckC
VSLTLALPSDTDLIEGVIARRVVSWLVDLVVIGLLISALSLSLLVGWLLTLGITLPALGLLPLVPFLYHALFLASSLSATPGQRLFGLVVRRSEDCGRPLPVQAVCSTLLFYLTLALGVVWLAIACLTVRRRILHDLLSGLVVVRARAFETGR